MTKKRLIQAMNEALVEEMERDSKVILFGEDVEISMFGDTRGLLAKFGSDRIRNTPISENIIAGMAAGAAGAGYHIVAHMMFGNFLYTGCDPIANQVAKLHWMTGGQLNFPVTYLAMYGGGRSLAAQHSDTPYPMLMNLGGVNVVVPSNSADAKGLLKTAIRGSNPTFFLVAGGRGGEIGEVQEGDHLVPLGQAAVLREGAEVTLIAIGAMVKLALLAAETLAQDRGAMIEVIDPRSLVPLDESTILASVAKTGRLVIVDEARDRCSAASHIAAVVGDRGFGALRAPIKRVTVPNVAMPYSPVLEQSVYPDAKRIAAALIEVLDYKRASSR